MVVPSRIESLVMPTSVWVAPPPPLPQPAMVRRAAANAANTGAFRSIETPPGLIDLYLNSLRIMRHLSSLPIARATESPVEARVAQPHQADQSVRGEDHDQDQDHAIRHRRTRVLDGRGDLVGKPRLAWHPLVGLDGQEVGEDRPEQRARDGGQAADDRSDEKLDRKRDGECVGADEP